MKQCIKIVSFAAVLCAVSAAKAVDATPDFVSDARSAVMTFQKTLKKELISAMQSGGPKKAVEVCHGCAPEIAEKLESKLAGKLDALR